MNHFIVSDIDCNMADIPVSSITFIGVEDNVSGLQLRCAHCHTVFYEIFRFICGGLPIQIRDPRFRIAAVHQGSLCGAPHKPPYVERVIMPSQ